MSENIESSENKNVEAEDKKLYTVEYDHKSDEDSRVACVMIGTYKVKLMYDSISHRCSMRATNEFSMLAPSVLLLENGKFQLHYDYVLVSDDSLRDFERAYQDAVWFCTEGKRIFNLIVEKFNNDEAL